MHTKTKGSIGEISVIKKFYELGIPVFSEFGDNCKVDLIILKDFIPFNVQVKALTSDGNKISLSKRSSGPGYSYVYQENEIDFMACYILDKDIVTLIPFKNFGSSSLTLRLNKTKNNQSKSVHYIDEYTDILGVLRDYEQDTLTSNVEGDDIVQTTTS